MPILTLENLDPNSFHYYDYTVYSRARAAFAEGRVKITAFDVETATCLIRGAQENHIVTLKAESKRQVRASCDCPQAVKGRICFHMMASLFAVRKYIETEAENQWRYRLQLALESSTKRKNPTISGTRYGIVFGLQREKLYEAYTYRLLPYRIKSTDWRELLDFANLPDQEAKNQLLDEERGWTRSAEVISYPLDYRAVVNLSIEGVHLYNMIHRMGGSYYGITDFATYLPILSRMNAPIFLITSRGAFKDRLYLINEPAKIEAALTNEGTQYSLQAGLRLGDETFTTLKGNLKILSSDPAWALAGSYLVPVDNPEAIGLMEFFPLVIPAEDEGEFREKFLQSILERIPIQGDVVSWTEVESDPLPRLYLRDDAAGGRLHADLRFGYGEYEVDANPRAEAVTLRNQPDSWGMLRIKRKLQKEDSFYQMLTDARFGLKRTGANFPPGLFELRARTHPLDFLLHSIPLLTQAGFEIYGEENLKTARLNRYRPTISLNISSGLDWFDVQAVIRFGDQEVALADVRRAMRKQERYIKLADGSIGQIPEEWVNRYKKLFDLAEETEAGLRVNDFHLPLVDTLLADADESRIAVEYKERRNRLNSFEQIKAQPVPRGFTGELRPYQKSGLDWLHFLHDYGFGGCLADDMGLGKTIQVLALLQSLREQGKLESPVLLVVPKSLIANWIREAERFTPGLRILEFMGNFRKKDPAGFKEWDIVLTTYGTMLRDIEFLRGVRFEYAILDESQAIKNPLAQSSKAARLLNAQHRLVMTGTPVENNTFELWSQFAFLNPGLLGSLEYFRREFGTPIESRSSEETVQLLRRLIYPFILRRTKDQVAPELPERTERILYTDFEPAQRKLYNHTRDYYRGLLMGLIDNAGINDARMKILEGLLRLRQLCIHPHLVDSSYHGESAKFEILLETIETLLAEGHKALIFSQFVQTLLLLRTELDARHIRYVYLDGQTTDRQAQVDKFQTDPAIPFFLISLKAGGVGLNLTAADYVIHIDPWWNPAVEMQAADRAHRIGQDKPVFIYKIIMRNSVEEKILQLQEHKKELVEQIISAEGSFFKSITKDDVKALFS